MSAWAPAQVAEVAGPDQVRWAIGPAGALIESSDGGATWHEVTVLTALARDWFRPFDLVAVADVVVDPDRPGVVYAVIVGAEGKSETFTVFETTDDGATWTPWTKPLVPDLYAARRRGRRFQGAMRSSSLTPALGAGAGSGIQTIRVVTPRGDRTVMRQRATPTRTWTGGLQVDRSGSRVLLQTTLGWMLSTDGGAHVHALGLAQAETPVFDPSGAGRLYALRGGTLFHSADAGRHWQRRGRAKGATVLAIDRGGLLVYASGPARRPDQSRCRRDVPAGRPAMRRWSD